MHPVDVVARDARQRFGRAANRMTVRRITKHNTRGNEPSDCAWLAQCERQIVKILLPQTFDLFILECWTANHIRKNLHRWSDLRRHYSDCRSGSIPARARLKSATEGLNRFSDLRRISGLRAFGK